MTDFFKTKLGGRTCEMICTGMKALCDIAQELKKLSDHREAQTTEGASEYSYYGNKKPIKDFEYGTCYAIAMGEEDGLQIARDPDNPVAGFLLFASQKAAREKMVELKEKPHSADQDLFIVKVVRLDP